MSTTTIRQILGSRPLLFVHPGATLRQAAAKMAENGTGAVAVIERERLAGILTERDIVFRCVGCDLSVDDVTAAAVMTRHPITVEIDDSISDALAKRLGGPFRHLPVMENDAVVGILSYRDIPAEYVMLFERYREMKASRADDLT